MKISRATKMVAILAACFAMALTPICAYAAPQQTAVVINTTEINTAIANKDYKPIYREFVKYYGDYFRLHYMEDNFPYFNVYDYMKKYPDVAKAMDYKPDKVLEHYLNYGIYEERSGCGKYDIGKFLRKNPSTILSADFANNVATPEKYFEANQTKIVEANTEGGTTSGGGGGSSSGGYTPSPSPTLDKTFTMMFYLSGADLETGNGEMTRAIVDAIFGAYDSDNLNVLITAGGSNTWKNPYLNQELSMTEEDTYNKAAVFSVDTDKATKILNTLAQENESTVDGLYTDIYNGTGKLSYNYVVGKILGTSEEDTVLTKVHEFSKKVGGSTIMADSDTLWQMLTIAETNYAADNYSLILSGHGGGCLMGMCSSQDNGREVLSVQSMEDAFKKAGFGDSASGNTFAFLGFDACLLGSAEIATKLSDYYEYMYGSETFQSGDLGYYSLVRCVNEYKNESDIANRIAYQAFDNRYKKKGNIGEIATAALFYYEYADETISSMNDFAKALNGSIWTDADKKTVYTSMKKALLMSYQIAGYTYREAYNYFDAKDYLGKLKDALTENDYFKDGQNKDVSDAIDTAIEQIDKFVIANLYNFNNQYIYKHEDGQEPVIQNEELMRKYLNYNFCGATFVIPSYQLTSVNFDISALDSQRDLLLGYIQKNYIDTYGVGLDSYSKLVYNYADYMLSAEEVIRVKQLIKEMTNGKQWISDNPDASPSEGEYASPSVSGYDELVSVTLATESENDPVLQIKVKDYDENSNKSEFSSGDAFVDLIDTTTAFTAYLTRRIYLALYNSETQKWDPTYDIDVIIAQKSISYSSLNPNGVDEESNVSKEIDVFANSLLYATYNYVQSGSSDYKWDALIPSDINNYSDKNDIVALLTEGGKSSDYIIYKGEWYTSETNPDKGECEHLFKLNSDGSATYVGSAYWDDDNKCYSVCGDTLTQISFGHYSIFEGKWNNDNYSGADAIVTVDTSGSNKYIDQSATEVLYYDTSDNKYYAYNKYNKADGITIMSTRVGDLDNETLSNGFYVVAKNGDGMDVCLNEKTDITTGTTDSEVFISTKTDEYAGPITQTSSTNTAEATNLSSAVTKADDNTCTQNAETDVTTQENGEKAEVISEESTEILAAATAEISTEGNSESFTETNAETQSTESSEKAAEPTEEPAAA